MIHVQLSHAIFAVLISVLLGNTTVAQEKTEEVKPVRMGCGLMTFETVPGWGLRPDGKSPLGRTHGSVVVDKAGHVYTSTNQGVFVFTPDGIVVKSYLGPKYSCMHDIEIRAEGDEEFIYGARNNNAEAIKFNAKNGKIVLKIPFPTESGLDGTGYKPTAVTISRSGDIYVADGYGSNVIFKFDSSGKYLSHFGEKGNELKQFNVCHGMTLDTRYTPNRLLICDRNHEPKGRLLHYGLDGEFIDVVVSGLGMPTAVAIQGDYVSVPDLHGRLVILDKSNTIMAVLGHNPDPEKRRNFKIEQKDWIEGIFSGTHGSYWDKDGNLYVQDWNVSGRLMKLVRVK
jgi:DNA-binding beta-propeller fold protein YncE